ncbi:hypothetical protein ACFC3O_26750 [Streptomyces sp. NPDC056007]|uniref:hypothetical protein n=1 Tax=Streptomyces sp. NPDC056007 TaxID=3345678 RepID=UPI0035DE01AB
MAGDDAEAWDALKTEEPVVVAVLAVAEETEVAGDGKTVNGPAETVGAVVVAETVEV